ncbi:LacI family DNA-binding transcriptional regulator [Streptomyces sp. NPDC014870]|uniref:LacI family DNA-binding transcriptional regulator n=1 Tax=Streptomyces sp. NPDC014870 TaxID=3364925 RepID=UPI0036F7B538
MTKRPTIRDVASLAGVSLATASRALSGDYPVAAQTRAKVQRAARELDYVVNAHARALSGAPAKFVALVVHSVQAPFFAYIAAGVEEQATLEDRLCLICTTHGSPERELEVVEAMREQRAEAVILVGGVVESEEYTRRMRRYAQSLSESGTRLVLVGRPPLGPDVPALTVEYDNSGGAFAAASHLLSAGHRKIAILAGEPGYTTSDQRLDGYRRAMAAYGIEPDPNLLLRGHLTRGAGIQMTRELLVSQKDFTAILAASDAVASGAYGALFEAGRSVPDDVSVVGFDDVPVAEDLRPALTTVHLPHEELGRTAVRHALQRSEQTKQHVVLGTHVVVRGSVAPRTTA